MQIPGVTQVYLFENSATVTHDEILSLDELVQNVESVMRTRLPVHNPNFQTVELEQTSKEKFNADYSDLSEDRRKIR